jgi:hypothetical protein
MWGGREYGKTHLISDPRDRAHDDEEDYQREQVEEAHDVGWLGEATAGRRKVKSVYQVYGRTERSSKE